MLSLSRLLRTVGHLKPSQVIWRAWLIALRRLETQPWYCMQDRLQRRVAGIECNNQSGDLKSPSLFGHSHSLMTTRADELTQGQLTLLSRRCSFAGGEDWLDAKGDSTHRLWQHTLHYHGWLEELAVEYTRGDRCAGDLLTQYLEDWINVCRVGQPGFANFAWNSFAIATRIGHWARIHAILPNTYWLHNSKLQKEFQQSFALQAAYLETHCEWDLRANHLLRDIVGLAWAGRFFTGQVATRWMKKATSLAIKQAHEQVLADGGHFERSPMYHIHVMEDFATLLQLLEEEEAREVLRSTLVRMSEWLCWMRHADGEIPLFNDSALNFVLHPTELFEKLEELGVHDTAAKPSGGRYFSDTGMVIWHGSPWTLFFDVGEIGPEYQPGHAHADTLGIECSCNGQRLFVDAGRHSYDRDHRRQYDRSTHAHNTVCIDETDSSEMWDIFRVGRRALPLDVHVDLSETTLNARASHDGYAHLAGSPIHSRNVMIDADGTLTIVDTIEGAGQHAASAGFLVDPAWSASTRPNGWKLNSGSGQIDLQIQTPVELNCSIVPAKYHPEHGCEIETVRLQWSYSGPLPLTVRTVIAAGVSPSMKSSPTFGRARTAQDEREKVATS